MIDIIAGHRRHKAVAARLKGLDISADLAWWEQVEKVFERLDEAAALLREHQWARSTYPEDAVCMECFGEEPDGHNMGPAGHKPDCGLAALLAKVTT